MTPWGRNYLRIVVAGAVIELAFLGLLLSGDLIDNKGRLLFFYFTAFAAYAAALASRAMDPKHIRVILFFAVLFRATMLLSEPSLTVDIYRYYWDGKLLANGVNPYMYPPAAMELEPLRDEIYQKLVYKQVNTIYPPLAQLVFALSYLVHPSLFTLKLASALFDLAAVLVLLRILKIKGVEGRVLLYAWNPLVVVEFASSGHADSMAVFFVLWAYYLLLRDRPFSAGAALALGVASKLYPVLLVPLFARRNPRAALGFLGVLVAVYLPFASAGPRLFEGLEVFLRYAKFNPGAFAVLEHLLGFASAKAVALLMVALAYPLVLRGTGLIRGCYLILTLYLVLSPMVHPWYVAWGLSLAPLVGSYSWVVFSALVGLSYLLVQKAPQGIIWVPDHLVSLAQFLPFYGIILWEELKRRRA
jgi:uncharacterized membrane protein